MIQLEKTKINLRQYIPSSIYDISATSDKYFGVNDIPRSLSLGKNLIRLNYNKNTLVPKSVIYIEFIDSNGNALYHEVLDTQTDDNSKLVVVYIYPDTPTGLITLYIAGKTSYNIFTGKYVNSNSDINLVWSTNIPVTTLKQNNSEVFFKQDPIVQFTERLVPYYTNTTGSVGKQAQYGSTSSSIYLNSTTNPYQFSEDNSKFSPSNDINRKVVIDPEFSAGKGTTKSMVKLPQYSSLQTITSNNFTFIPEMEGGLIILNGISLLGNVPNDAINSSSFVTTTSYSSSIIKVINNSTIQVDKPFYYTTEYFTKAGTSKTFSLNILQHNVNITASYYSPGTMSQTAATESFVTFNFKNIEPAAGTVDKIHIKYKPIGSFGEFIDVGEFSVLEQNLLTDSGSLYQTPRNGLIEKEIGYIKSNSDISSYWSIDSSSYSGIVTTIYTSSKVVDAISVSHSGINSVSKFIKVYPKLSLPAEANTEYKLSFKTFIENDRSGSIPNQIDVYISGSSISTGIIKNVSKTDVVKNIIFGTYVGSITNEVNTINSNNIFFKVLERKDIRPIFVVRSGNWTLGQIGIYPRKEIGFSPNHVKLNIPVSLFRRQTDMIVNIDYLNEDGIKGNTFTKIYGAYISGSNAVFIGRDNQFTGSFSGSFQGDGRALSVSWSMIAGTPSGLISSSIDTASFIRTVQTGGFAVTGSNTFVGTQIISGPTNTFSIYDSGIEIAQTTGSGTTVNINLYDQEFNLQMPSGSKFTYVLDGNPTFTIEGQEVSVQFAKLTVDSYKVITSNDTSSFALKTDISGAFDTSSLVRNSSTSSFVTNAQTSSFAIKTNISGAFDSTSGSITNRVTTIENTRLFSSVTASIVFNASTSSFANKTEITGAFTSLSSSITTRTTTIENTMLLSSVTASYVPNSLTGSWIRNAQTGGFATTGSNNFIGTNNFTGSLNFSGSVDGNGFHYSATNFSGAKWGILKVHGETTGSVSGSTFTSASAPSNFGELAVEGTVIIPEDLSSTRYIYGIKLAETSSVTWQMRFPIFRNNDTGILYGTSGSRFGSMTAEMTLMIYGSGSAVSSRPDSIWAYNWRSRFYWTPRSISQSSAATSTAYGVDPGYDSWITVAATMGGSGPGTGISTSNGFLTIPITFLSGDTRNYSLYATAEMKVVKFEFN